MLSNLRVIRVSASSPARVSAHDGAATMCWDPGRWGWVSVACAEHLTGATPNIQCNIYLHSFNEPFQKWPVHPLIVKTPKSVSILMPHGLCINKINRINIKQEMKEKKRFSQKVPESSLVHTRGGGGGGGGGAQVYLSKKSLMPYHLWAVSTVYRYQADQSVGSL